MSNTLSAVVGIRILATRAGDRPGPPPAHPVTADLPMLKRITRAKRPRRVSRIGPRTSSRLRAPRPRRLFRPRETSGFRSAESVPPRRGSPALRKHGSRHVRATVELPERGEERLFGEHLPVEQDRPQAERLGARALVFGGANHRIVREQPLGDKELFDAELCHLSGCDQARSRRPLPGLKRIVFPGGIVTSTPVLGLRPIPRLRRLT